MVNGIACYLVVEQRLVFDRECSNRSGDAFLHFRIAILQPISLAFDRSCLSVLFALNYGDQWSITRSKVDIRYALIGRQLKQHAV